MNKAIIKRVTKGRHIGEFRFILKASNGEVVAVSHPETYTQKHNAINVILSHFPGFEIEDQTTKEFQESRRKRKRNNAR